MVETGLGCCLCVRSHSEAGPQLLLNYAFSKPNINQVALALFGVITTYRSA